MNNIQKMKKISLLIFSVFVLASCGNSERSVEDIIEEGNLSEIRAKKAELSKVQSDLSSQIASLDAAIEKLDKQTQFALVRTMRYRIRCSSIM